MRFDLADLGRLSPEQQAAVRAQLGIEEPVVEPLSERDVREERRFLGRVVGALRTAGWLAFHCHDSRRSEPGLPDVIAVRGSTLLALELKTPDGRVTAEQERWLDALARVERVEAKLVRPEQWEEILEVIR